MAGKAVYEHRADRDDINYKKDADKHYVIVAKGDDAQAANMTRLGLTKVKTEQGDLNQPGDMLFEQPIEEYEARKQYFVDTHKRLECATPKIESDTKGLVAQPHLTATGPGGISGEGPITLTNKR